ncbi:MAG: Gfo/Idh/MocA family oxidoreductase [Verrucomicrobiota bacterium]
MGISIGLVGLGGFGSCFADLFKSHPLVSRVALCDLETERIKKFADKPSWQDKFHPRDAYDSLEAICRSDVDALVIITQPWLHASQCVQALEAGKHVYSAVPIISIPDGDEILMWCDRLVNTCRKTGLSYMLGETTYYRPQTMFCRRKAADGAFGNFIYAEGEYFHDVDERCSLREVEKRRATGKAGQEGRAIAQTYRAKGIQSGPMHYPTHSTSGPVCVMNAHALKATGYGYRNQNHDPFFNGYAFSNETALFQMSNGATVRICEFREVAGGIADESETFRILGTRGSFCENHWKENQRTSPTDAKPLTNKKLTIADMRDPLPPEVYAEFKKHSLESDVYGGHGGSHAYLVHEFVDAVAHGRQPAINIWEAARYMAMGVMAHKSALKDGETLTVPDWGDAPA